MNLKSTSLVPILLWWVLASAAAAAGTCTQQSWPADSNNDLLTVNATGIGVITAWGLARWDYFTTGFHRRDEGGFDNFTESGGADKLGHLYTGYVAAHGLSALYEHWCHPADQAALYGALSSLLITGYMEIADGYSRFGFSDEDMLANTLGSLLGYWTWSNPDIARKLDIRWEYGLDPEGNDFVTDYNNSKYLAAIKLGGFEPLRDSFLKYIELQLGYYTRGYHQPVANERITYIAIGLNLTDLFRRNGYRKTAAALRYVQVPGTYLAFERDINR